VKTDKLKAYEAAAREYCKMTGDSPDEMVANPHQVFAAVTAPIPFWCVVADQMRDMSRMIVALQRLREERIDLIGGQMANVMYNWRQDDKRFTERERKMMDDLQAAWDAALRELTHG
jgi:hypothetical protein